MPTNTSRGVDSEAWKGRKSFSGVIVHRPSLWATAAQSRQAPLGDDEDYASELPYLRNENIGGAFTHHLPFIVSWWLLPGTLIPGYCQPASFVGRYTKKPSAECECQWSWVGHQQYLPQLPTKSEHKQGEGVHKPCIICDAILNTKGSYESWDSKVRHYNVYI